MWRASALILLTLALTHPALADEMAACDGPDLRQSIEACTALLRNQQPTGVRHLALRNRAIRELSLNDLLGASADAEKAITLKADDIVVRLVAANALAKMGKLGDAKRQVSEALKLDPTSAEALTQESLIEVKIGNYDEAIAAASKAIEVHPQNAAALNNRGLAYRAKGDYAKAILDFDRTIRMDPRIARPFFNRGIAYKKMGNGKAALEDFGRALELDPNNSEWRSARDILKYQMGKDEAIAAHHQDQSNFEVESEGRAIMHEMIAKIMGGQNLTANQEKQVLAFTKIPSLAVQANQVIETQNEIEKRTTTRIMLKIYANRAGSGFFLLKKKQISL